MKKLFSLCVAFVLALGGCAFSAFAYEKLPLYETLPEWTLVWTDADHSKGTIETDQKHGDWKIHVARSGSWYGGYALTVCCDPAKAANRSVIQGEGFLDLRGTIIGPSHANAATNAVYRIGKLDDNVFRANDGSGNSTAAEKITGLYTPGTLMEMSSAFHNDGSPYSKVQDVYIVEPTLQKLPDWLCSGCRSFQCFYLDCATMTTIGGPICNCGGPQADGATLFDEWNLPSVTTAGVKSNQAGSFGNWPKATGTLNLPSAKSINDSYAFASTGMGGVLLGARGNLEYVGSNAFSNCSSLTNVFLGPTPAGRRLTLGTSAFASANLKRVWFNGDNPPTFAPCEKTYTFGTSATAEGAITFYVRDTPGWAAVLAEADANGGLVAASRFDTAQRQRVVRFDGVAYDPEGEIGRIFDARFVAKFGEKVTVTSAAGDFPYLEKGFFALPATLTASCSDEADEKGRKAHFHRWDGVPVDVERNASITLSDEMTLRAIRPMFVHDWYYDTAAGTIENGIWKLKVGVVDKTARTLKLGTANSQPTTMLTGVGNGILDLNGDVRDGDGNLWTIVTTTRYCMTKLRNWDNDKPDSTATMAVDHPTVIVFPETITTLVSDEFNFNQSRQWPLEEVVFIAPECTGKTSFTVNGPMKLTRFTFRAPKMTEIGFNTFWQNMTLSETDVSTWDLSGVTTIGPGAFQGSMSFAGTLSLPSLVAISNDNFKGYSKLEGVILATNLTLTSVGTNVFNNCAALKTVVVGNAKSGCMIGASSFANATKPASVTFLGKCNSEAADRVLTGTAATDGAKTATVYASSALGWERFVAPPVGDEAASIPAEANGVYREGSRKAWYVDCPSPFDPKGLILFVR